MTIQAENFLNTKQLADLFDVSERTVERWREDGGGPPFIALGARRIAYRQSDVFAWVEAQTKGKRAA